ncbi:MAG: nucleoside hydrolase [Planctomycetota bacterium]|nr:MAG: nucleoside hydrolase [Planctomycetota bacterium]
MTKKLLLDVDPGIDDAVALCLALFDPQIEVVAVTAVGGNVPPEQATRNVQAVVEQLDPPRRPRIGEASEPDMGLPRRNVQLHGPDGLGNSNFEVSQLQHRHPSDKVIYEEVRAAPGEVTIVALGPLTNVARALARDPALGEMVSQIVIMGGTLAGVGNVTPAADFNIYCDPESARAVFRSSAATKTLVPIDVSCQVTFGYDLLEKLPREHHRVGRFLRGILPYLFRSYRQELGYESICLNDAVALLAALHPELFEVDLAAVDVELSGELTRGATVFDRRRVREWRTNVAVATKLDVAAARDCILRGISAAAAASG